MEWMESHRVSRGGGCEAACGRLYPPNNSAILHKLTKSTILTFVYDTDSLEMVGL